jgi:hypothetical protein
MVSFETKGKSHIHFLKVASRKVLFHGHLGEFGFAPVLRLTKIKPQFTVARILTGMVNRMRCVSDVAVLIEQLHATVAGLAPYILAA